MSESREVVIRMNPWAAGIVATVLAALVLAAFFSVAATRDLARSTNQLANTNSKLISQSAADYNQMVYRLGQVESRLSVVEDRQDRASKKGTSLVVPKPSPKPIPASYDPQPINNKEQTFRVRFVLTRASL